MTRGCWLYAAPANHMGTGWRMLLHSCWKRGHNTLDCMDLLVFLITCLCFELSSAAPSVVCVFFPPCCILLHAVMHGLVLVIVIASALHFRQGFTHLHFSYSMLLCTPSSMSQASHVHCTGLLLLSLVLKCVLQGLAHSCYTLGMLLCACLLCLHRPHVYTAGLHTSAFFFGHAAMHMIDILVQPAIFMSLYYTLTLPEIKFIDYYFGMVSNYCTANCCKVDCFSRWSLHPKPSLSLRSSLLTTTWVWSINYYSAKCCNIGYFTLRVCTFNCFST